VRRLSDIRTFPTALHRLMRLRTWAAERLQTVFRTISGMMKHREALKMLLHQELPELSPDEHQALVTLKFRLVVAVQTCAEEEERRGRTCLACSPRTFTQPLQPCRHRMRTSIRTPTQPQRPIPTVLALAPSAHRYANHHIDAGKSNAMDMHSRADVKLMLERYPKSLAITYIHRVRTVHCLELACGGRDLPGTGGRGRRSRSLAATSIGPAIRCNRSVCEVTVHIPSFAGGRPFLLVCDRRH
jgi:hypothetical protein